MNISLYGAVGSIVSATQYGTFPKLFNLRDRSHEVGSVPLFTLLLCGCRQSSTDVQRVASPNEASPALNRLGMVSRTFLATASEHNLSTALSLK